MKSVLTTTVLFLFLTLNLFAQFSIQESFESMGSVIISLPFCGNEVLPHSKAYHFPTESINSDVAQKLWTDVQLTQSTPNEFQFESLRLRFNPTNGNYWIGMVQTGAGDLYKEILVTVSPEGEFIDAIDVKVRGSHGLAGYIHVMQWKLDENMKVTTYRIKPTQTTPIPWDNQASSFYGQRIDTEYQVTPQGQFVKINEVKYAAKTYTYHYLADKTSHFWNGNETRME